MQITHTYMQSPAAQVAIRLKFAQPRGKLGKSWKSLSDLPQEEKFQLPEKLMKEENRTEQSGKYKIQIGMALTQKEFTRGF